MAAPTRVGRISRRVGRLRRPLPRSRAQPAGRLPQVGGAGSVVRRFGRRRLQQAQRLLHRALELRVAAGDHVLGEFSTSMSGRDALVLDGPLAVASEEAAARRDHGAAVHERRRVGRCTSPPQVRVPTSGPIFRRRNMYGIRSPPEPGHLVDDHHLRPPDARRGLVNGMRSPAGVVEVAVEVAAEDVDDVVGRRAAAVVALVDHGALLVLLREVVAVEAHVAGLAGVGHVHVGELPARELVDQPAVVLHPRARAQALVVRRPAPPSPARARQGRTSVHADHGLPVGGAVEQPVDVVAGARSSTPLMVTT